MSKIQPRLWSDFDGTAVRKYGYKNLRNWSKYPLPAIPGYLDFLTAVQETGVDFAGVVTSRKEWLRHHATNRSLKKLGYLSIIQKDNVVYAGKEQEKGNFLGKQSRIGVVGMIDDKPHNVGTALLNIVRDLVPPYLNVPRHPIVLGAVAHDKTQDYLDNLVTEVLGRAGSQSAHIDEVPGLVPETPGIHVKSRTLDLTVLPLMPYSHEAGEAFGRAILDRAA